MKCAKCGYQNGPGAKFCGDCGVALAAPAVDISGLQTLDEGSTRHVREPAADKLEVGAMFADRYRIEQVVGEGGMGVVYRAADKVTDRSVALKLIRADRLGGGDAVKRLIREGVTSRDIRHPNVVAVYDVNELGGQPYMSMEFLSGTSLRAWNRARLQSGGDVSMRTAGHIINEILNGLEAAHKEGVIHRDLKPENVILLENPSDQGAKLKILDFGIARVGGGGDTGASSLGTRGYMAPEQITAPDAAQASADLYSLSVMFYELLVGVPPLGHWQPPSGGRSDVSQKIDELIHKGLSNNPRARPQSCDEYRRALQEGLRTTGPGPTPWNPTPPPIPNPPPGPGPGPTPKPRPFLPAKSRPYWEWFVYSVTKRYADGKGRAHRFEYWSFMLVSFVVMAAAFAVDLSLETVTVDSDGIMIAPITYVVMLVLYPPSISVLSRRFHDQNMSGWLAALSIFVPIALFVVIGAGLQRGTPTDNPYGPDPLGGRQV